MTTLKAHPMAIAAAKKGGTVQSSTPSVGGSMARSHPYQPPLPTPTPHAAPPAPGVGMVTSTKPPIAAPGGGMADGYLHVRQKQPDGSWKVVLMHRSKLSADQVRRAQGSELNTPQPGVGVVAPGTPPPVGMRTPAAQPAPAASAPAAPVAQPPAGQPGAPSAIPRISFGDAYAPGGQIDWGSLASQVQGVSAMDTGYASALSNALAQARQATAQPYAELQSLGSIVPELGGTRYDVMLANAMRNTGQQRSSAMGNAAARGIGHSGMVNQSFAAVNAQGALDRAALGDQYGPARRAALSAQIQAALGAQDESLAAAYFDALGRRQQAMPSVDTAGVLGG